MKKWQSIIDSLTLDGYTEKEIDDRIAKEKRRVERIKNKIIDMRFDLHSTRNCIDMWKAMKNKLLKLKREAVKHEKWKVHNMAQEG